MKGIYNFTLQLQSQLVIKKKSLAATSNIEVQSSEHKVLDLVTHFFIVYPNQLFLYN